MSRFKNKVSKSFKLIQIKVVRDLNNYLLKISTFKRRMMNNEQSYPTSEKKDLSEFC